MLTASRLNRTDTSTRIVVVVFTQNRSFYPKTSAVLSGSVRCAPRLVKSVVVVVVEALTY